MSRIYKKKKIRETPISSISAALYGYFPMPGLKHAPGMMIIVGPLELKYCFPSLLLPFSSYFLLSLPVHTEEISDVISS